MRLFFANRCCSLLSGRGKWALLAMVACQLPPRAALAQAMSTTLEQATPLLFAKTWAITYALVLLAVALGLLVVCRPAPRQKTIKKKKTGRR